MKKWIIILSLFSVLLITTSVFATSVKLTLESYSPASLPTISTIIDIADINNQLEISRQAGLFALSSEGWNLASYGGWLQYREPPSWYGHFYFVSLSTKGQDCLLLQNLFGYALNQEALTYGPEYYLYFHTDELVGRLSHNVGEPSGYGVIGGGSGGFMAQCMVQNWGRFYIEENKAVPEPATILLSGLGLAGLVGMRRKLNIR